MDRVMLRLALNAILIEHVMGRLRLPQASDQNDGWLPIL